MPQYVLCPAVTSDRLFVCIVGGSPAMIIEFLCYQISTQFLYKSTHYSRTYYRRKYKWVFFWTQCSYHNNTTVYVLYTVSQKNMWLHFLQ